MASLFYIIRDETLALKYKGEVCHELDFTERKNIWVLIVSLASSSNTFHTSSNAFFEMRLKLGFSQDVNICTCNRGIYVMFTNFIYWQVKARDTWILICPNVTVIIKVNYYTFYFQIIVNFFFKYNIYICYLILRKWNAFDHHDSDHNYYQILQKILFIFIYLFFILDNHLIC